MKNNPGVSLVLAFVLVFTILGLLGGMVTPVDASPLGSGENGTRDAKVVTPMAVTGIAQSLAATSGDGNMFVNTGKTFVVINNTSGSTITGTFVTAGTVDGLAIADVDVAVTNGQTKLVGPFTTGVFNQPSGTDRGKIYVNWNAAVTGTVTASVTWAIFELD